MTDNQNKFREELEKILQGRLGSVTVAQYIHETADSIVLLVSSCLPENNYTGQGSEYNRGKFDGVDETIKLMKDRLGIK